MPKRLPLIDSWKTGPISYLPSLHGKEIPASGSFPVFDHCPIISQQFRITVSLEHFDRDVDKSKAALKADSEAG